MSIRSDIELTKLEVNQLTCRVTAPANFGVLWAAYAMLDKFHSNCDANVIVRDIRALGADAIFIHMKGYPHTEFVLANGVNVPVFALDDSHSGFFNVIENTFEHVSTSYASQTIHLHLDLDNVSQP